MTNVHGISVSGGSFPAEIWRRFMDPALAALPARDFPEPRQPVTFQTWHRGPSALSYDPYYVAPAAPETTTEETPAAPAPGKTSPKAKPPAAKPPAAGPADAGSSGSPGPASGGRPAEP